MIHAIHIGDDCTRIANDIRSDVDRMISELKNEPSILNLALVQDALGEYAEAFIFSSVVKGLLMYVSAVFSGRFR